MMSFNPFHLFCQSYSSLSLRQHCRNYEVVTGLRRSKNSLDFQHQYVRAIHQRGHFQAPSKHSSDLELMFYAFIMRPNDGLSVSAAQPFPYRVELATFLNYIFTAKWRSLRGLQAGFQHRTPSGSLIFPEKVMAGKFKCA